MRFNLKRSLILAMGAAGIAGAGLVSAQTQPQSPPPPQPERPQPQQPQQAVQVTDQEVQHFAEVYTESRSVRQEYSEKFQNAENQEEAQAIQQEMNDEMMEIIEASPLTPQRYQEIASATAQNDQLRQRILDELNGQ